MKSRLMCTVCGETFAHLDDAKLAWIDPDTRKRVPGPRRFSGHKGYLDWWEKGYVLTCSRGHVLPEDPLGRPLLVMSTFGQPQAAKGTFVREFTMQLRSGEISRRGTVSSLDIDEYKTLYPPKVDLSATLPADEQNPRKPIHVELQRGRTEPPINLAVFDTGYEDLQNAKHAKKVAKFIGHVDTLVFFVPPPALSDLPQHVKSGQAGLDEPQDPATTADVIDLAVNIVRQQARRIRRRKEREAWLARKVVFIVLSKADRYIDYGPFPQELLVKRPFRSVAQDQIVDALVEDQVKLYDFVVAAGGQALINAAGALNGKVYLTAVSGTGSDLIGRPAAQVAAPNRTLDPLVTTLLREGVAVAEER